MRVSVGLMGRFRDMTARLLLAAFVAGGLLSPSLHRVHHALERAAEASCHTDAVHRADVPTLASDEAAVNATQCALCVTRLLVVLPSIESLKTSTVLGAPAVEKQTHLAPQHVFTDRAIRGPPLLS